MRSHLSRKEMKRDEVREALGRIILRIRDNVRAIAIGGGVVLGIALLILFAALWKRAQAGRSQDELSRALKVYNAEILEVDADPDNDKTPSFASEALRLEAAKEGFEALLDDYGSSAAAQVATVYLGEIAAEEGDAATARSLWGQFLDENAGHALAATVELSLVSLDREEGRLEEVAARLESQLDAVDRSLPEDVVLFELGQILEKLGRDQDAQDKFQRLVDDHPRSPYTARAQQRLRERPT